MKNIETPLDYETFSEKMLGLVVTYYNKPDEFFVIAKNVFINSYKTWKLGQASSALISLFRNCYRAYNSEEKRKLGERIISFTVDLELSQTTFTKVYESMFFTFGKRMDGMNFLLSAIKYPQYQDAINNDFVEEFESVDSFYRDLFLKKNDELSSYLYDSTYLSIAEKMTDRYTIYDNVLLNLLKNNKTNIIIAFLNNKNLLITKDCLSQIISYARKKKEVGLLKTAYRTYLFKNNISFVEFYEYYNLLTAEEREEETYFLNRIVNANHLEKPFAIMNKDSIPDEDLLLGLTINDFNFLASIIKKDYKDVYLKYLISSFKKRLNIISKNDDDIFELFDKYSENIHELLNVKGLNEYSFNSTTFRRKYLLFLIKGNMMNETNIHLYEE